MRKEKRNMDFNENLLIKIPKGWIQIRLEDILDFIKGKKPKNLGPKDDSRKIPYINIDAFENKVFEQYTDGDGCPLCKKDDILIVWDGARCGLVGRGVEGVIGSTLAKLVSYEIDKSYLFYFLQSKFDYINKRPRGVGIPHVEPDIFWNIDFPLAPLAEQHRIVAKIEELFTKLDAGVEALKKAKEQIKRYRQSVLKYAFEGKLTEEWRKIQNPLVPPLEKGGKGGFADLPKLPEAWRWTNVNDIADKIHYGYTASAIEKPVGPKMLRITDIQNNKVDWKSVPYCQIGPEEKQKYLLNEGDLVFARTGATVGKSYLVKGNIPEAVFASYLIRVILNNQVDRNYVYYFFQSHIYWVQIHKGQIGIGQPNVNSQKLAKIILPLAPFEEQQQIVSEIERRFAVADAVEKVIDNSLKQAERLRQSILKKAFEGKLVPQDPNDEPASELLKRIKESKENMQSQKSKNKGKK
ncbi:MAG: restriction endonuclease subunit S [candidate division WOR-3 bacterium]